MSSCTRTAAMERSAPRSSASAAAGTWATSSTTGPRRPGGATASTRARWSSIRPKKKTETGVHLSGEQPAGLPGGASFAKLHEAVSDHDQDGQSDRGPHTEGGDHAGAG